MLYELDRPTHLSEEFDHRRLRDAPVMTQPLFVVLEYLEQ